MLAKPVVVQEAQLLGKWQCVPNDKTPKTFTFGSGQKVSVIVDMTFPTTEEEADGTWTLDGGKIGLNIKITDVQRQHSTAKIRTILWRKVDKEMFTQMRNDIGKSDKSQMQVKKIGNDSLSVRMQGESQDMACRKV